MNADIVIACVLIFLALSAVVGLAIGAVINLRDRNGHE